MKTRGCWEGIFAIRRSITCFVVGLRLEFVSDSSLRRFGCRGSGPNQFDNPGGVTTTNEHYGKVVVADTGNRRVCLFRVKSDHYGYGSLDLNFYFGHQIFRAPTGVEWDHRRNMLVVADQVCLRASIRIVC
jgi:hypothetical protein